MAKLQFYRKTPTSPLRPLFTPGGKLAMSPECCCFDPSDLCGGCKNTHPPYLKWALNHYPSSEECTGQPTLDCRSANGTFILEFMDPQPPDSEYGDFLVLDGPSCKYLYTAASPWEHGADGWIAELFTFNVPFGIFANMLVYQNGGTKMGDTTLSFWDGANGGPGWEFYQWQMGGLTSWLDSCYQFTRCDNWDYLGEGNFAQHNKFYDRAPACGGVTAGHWGYAKRTYSPPPPENCCNDAVGLTARLEPWFEPTP